MEGLLYNQEAIATYQRAAKELQELSHATDQRIGTHEVAFVLPSGVSRYEMLRETQGLIAERDDRDLARPPESKN